LRIAFIFINVEPGSEAEVLERLRAVSEIKESHVVYGMYDLVARVEADAMDRLKEVITWKIRKLDKVKSTLTTVVIEEK
jgi:DNA-binding Lrp family transcriptional regulator